MDLDRVHGATLAILTSPVAEERRKVGRHDAVVAHVRADARH